MELLFIRHGETQWNVIKKVQGRIDIELNNNGIKHANSIKNYLKNEQIDLIITSPLIRARQTAEIIKGKRDIAVNIEPRLIERDFGEFEGTNYNEFDFKGFWSYKKNQIYKKAENIRDFFDRIFEILDEIKNKYPNKRVLIVAHAGVSIPTKCYFNGIPDIDTLYNLAIKNCEIARFNTY